MMRSLLLLLTIFATGTDGYVCCTESHPTCSGGMCETALGIPQEGSCRCGNYRNTNGIATNQCKCTTDYVPPPAPVDCILTDFDAWTSCSKSCGTGVQSRNRSVQLASQHGGVACSALSESQNCKTQLCPPPVATMCQVNYNSTVTISGGTNMKVKFELCKGWPKDGKLTIVPPGGYSISEDATATMSASGVTGGLSVLVNDENIIISLNGDGILATESDHAVEIEITGVIIKAPVPHNYRNSSTDFAYVVSGQSGPVVTTTIEVTGVTETDLKADDEAQASLVGAVAASSAVGASLVSLTKIGDTLITRRRLESEELTLTFELKTGSAEAAKSLKQKLESTTFVSSVNALLAGTGIVVTGSPKAAIAGALAAVGNSTSTGNNSTGNSTSTGNNSTGNSTSTGNNSNDASTEKEEVIT